MPQVKFSDTLKLCCSALQTLKSGKSCCPQRPRIVHPGAKMTSHATASHAYSTTSPTRAEVDTLEGATVLEFGTDWCGYCKAAQPLIGQAFEAHPEVRRLKVEDGPGRPLGRSFKVKLWPTLIFLRDGAEVARVVRPTEVRAVVEGLNALA
jgi:thioredoxin 1